MTRSTTIGVTRSTTIGVTRSTAVSVTGSTAICVTSVTLSQTHTEISGRQPQVGAHAPAAVTGAVSATNKSMADKFAADNSMADKSATGNSVSDKSATNDAAIKARVEAAVETATPAV